MTLYEWTVPQFSKMLTNALNIMDKAAAHADQRKFDVNLFLASRLAPDQFAFLRQIQIACDTAKLSVSRLTGKTAPVHEDKETSWSELRQRVQDTLKFLGTVKEADFVSSETVTVSQPRWEGKTLKGRDYTIHHAVPNFYFHLTTAYAILRHCGVEVGKKDYLGPMPW